MHDTRNIFIFQEDDGNSKKDKQDGVIMVTSAHCFGGCDQDYPFVQKVIL